MQVLPSSLVPTLDDVICSRQRRGRKGPCSMTQHRQNIERRGEVIMAKTYPMLSSDGHLEVLPERWTNRMPAKYRELAPRTTTLADGSDAIVMEGAGPFKVNYIDLRGGRKADDWQPVGVKVENTPGCGRPLG
jgi:hypothetical protein